MKVAGRRARARVADVDGRWRPRRSEHDAVPVRRVAEAPEGEEHADLERDVHDGQRLVLCLDLVARLRDPRAELSVGGPDPDRSARVQHVEVEAGADPERPERRAPARRDARQVHPADASARAASNRAHRVARGLAVQRGGGGARARRAEAADGEGLGGQHDPSELRTHVPGHAPAASPAPGGVGVGGLGVWRRRDVDLLDGAPREGADAPVLRLDRDPASVLLLDDAASNAPSVAQGDLVERLRGHVGSGRRVAERDGEGSRERRAGEPRAPSRPTNAALRPTRIEHPKERATPHG